MTTVHFVEPGGRGGIYQHSVALARSLHDAGVVVQLWTAARPEHLPMPDGVRRRRCSWFFPRLRPRPVRQLAALGAWLGVGVPSFVAGVAAGDVVHVQGTFRHAALLVPVVVAARARRCIVVFSPHNTFSRRGSRIEDAAVVWMARRAHAVPVFSSADAARALRWRARVVRAPFPVELPPADPEMVAEWRRRWLEHGGKRVVLFAGQVRGDKGLDVLVRAAADWDDELVLAVVGEDAGGLAAARREAAERRVRIVVDEGYQPLPRLVAAVTAADVIACPYRRASRSSVMALARAVGTPTVAAAVGGLPEWATQVVEPDDPAALTLGIRRALAVARRAAAPSDDLTIARRYLDIYDWPRPVVPTAGPLR